MRLRHLQSFWPVPRHYHRIAIDLSVWYRSHLPLHEPSSATVLRYPLCSCYATTGWSHRLAWPRTEPSQGSNTGSNPVGTTNTYAIPELTAA